MDAGTRLRSLLPGADGRRRPSLGFSQMELLTTFAIAATLALAGLAVAEPTGLGLTVVSQDLQGCLDQAFHQARAQGRNVTIAPASVGGPNIIPLHIPRGVRWGKPDHIPVPPGMDPPKVAAATGEAHPKITITPRHTVTATAWFLNDGKESLCVRLSGQGRLEVLRYRLRSHRWERA